MFGPHLLTSEIQFGACDELDARAVTASEHPASVWADGRDEESSGKWK